METRLIYGVSKKSGKEYYAVEVTLSEGYKKLVFLNDSEVALVKLAHGQDAFVKR